RPRPAPAGGARPQAAGDRLRPADQADHRVGAAAMAPVTPERIDTEDELDEVLTRPRPVLVEFIKTLSSPLVVLGAGGSVGPTLAALARRAAQQAAHPLEVFAVSRFTDERARQWLEARGVRTRSLDLLDRAACRELPDAAQVLSLVGRKFGTAHDAART